jgi:DNA (cytosine-5)-methyltransferase 1
MSQLREPDDTIRAVDLFCGGGGMSTALALACEDIDRDVEFAAVNHDSTAIDTHKANHPGVDHYNAKVEGVNPREVFPNERVDLLIGAPECTHHSTARGGRPKNPQKRASAWHIVRWLEHLYVDSFIIENVPELTSWGPLGADGTPLESKKGQTFKRFLDVLYSLDYSVDFKVLNSANYGDATARRRLFIVGQRNNRVEFPEQSHSENGEEPGTKPWRSASEIINWEDKGESIWGRKTPLVNNTMQRIAEGIRRHGPEEMEPFAQAVEKLTKPEVGRMQEDAVPVEDLSEALEERSEPFLVEGSFVKAAGPDSDGEALQYILRQQSGGSPPNADEPLPTISTRGAIAKIEAEGFVLPRNGYHRGLDSNPAYDPDDRPMHTITAHNHDGHVVTPYLVPYYSEREGQAPRTHDIASPLPTVTATGSDPSVIRPFLVQYYGNSSDRGVDRPLPTVTTKGRFGLCVPEMYPFGLQINYRMLQPDELAAAMGFPKSYHFCGNNTETTKQIGNAVPIQTSRKLIETVLTTNMPTLFDYGTQSTSENPAGSSVTSD